MGEFQSHERRNWLLHWCFVRGDLENCEKLCKEALSQSAGLSLYPLTINALLLRQQGKLQVTLPYRDINKTECFFIPLILAFQLTGQSINVSEAHMHLIMAVFIKSRVRLVFITM